MYQRGKIQDESLYYEEKKHSGELPIVGVNTFLPRDAESLVSETKLIRSTEEEKRDQVEQASGIQARFAKESPAALERLKDAVRRDKNVFEELMEAAKVLMLGQISQALFEVGGAYRRNM